MNKSILTALGGIALIATLVGAGGLAMAHIEALSVRYPAVQQDIGEQIDLGLLSQGILRETGAYRTDDAPLTVAAWYEFRDRLQREPARQPSDACIRLVKEDSYRIARQTLVVSLCPSGAGTAISFNRQLTVGR